MFLKILFFSFAVLAILWESYNVLDHKTITSALRAAKGLKFDELSERMQKFKGWNGLYWIWAIVGLFSSQWVLFLVFLWWTFFSHLVKPPRYVKGFISMCILIFIVVNAFHLHIKFY